MEGWLIALIVILVVHYFCAIFTIWLLLKDKLVAGQRIKKAPLILWNLLVLFLPVIGPAAYLICRAVQKRRQPPAPETAAEQRESGQNSSDEN